MEKAIDRQRVLLRHLNPAAAAASPAPPAISVRTLSLSLSLSRSLGPNRWSDLFGGVVSGPRSVTDRRGCCVCVGGCVAGERVRGGGQRGVPPDAGLRRRRRHRRVSGIRLPGLLCFDRQAASFFLLKLLIAAGLLREFPLFSAAFVWPFVRRWILGESATGPCRILVDRPRGIDCNDALQ